MGGEEPGQDAGPPVHAVRVRDVLQLDGLGALLTCRDGHFLLAHVYAPNGILTHGSRTLSGIAAQHFLSF